MAKKTRTNSEKILLGLSLAGGLGILPFAVFRLLQFDLAIGIMDLLASIGMISIFFYVYYTQKIRFATKSLFILALTAMVLTIYLKGAQQMYWVYPALISGFYLLNPKTGLIYTGITVVLILPKLYQDTSIFTFGTMMVTLLITISFAYIFASQEKRHRELLLEQATKDPLTGAGNRRALNTTLNRVISSFKRTSIRASILILDMDHFKNINDTFGHSAGDRFLVELTRLLNARIRKTDSLFRFGGEEFIVVAENTTLEAGQLLAEELRATIEEGSIIPEATITTSIGIAELKADESDDQWIKRADDALFKAKESGRNRVCIAED